MIPHYGAVKIATSFLIIQVTWVELGSWWVELVGRCGWPLGGIDGHHLGPEKVAVIRVAANQGFLKHCGEWRCVLDPRYQGWSLRGVPLYLSMFEYTLKFRGTKEHANADALSRLPLPVEPASVETPPELVLLTDHLSESPVTASEICSWTRKDQELAPVVQYLQQGWPRPNSHQVNSALAPYLACKAVGAIPVR